MREGEERCKECRWFDADPFGYRNRKMPEHTPIGYCRKYAPIMVDPGDEEGTQFGRWPIVTENDGCGEFDLYVKRVRIDAKGLES